MPIESWTRPDEVAEQAAWAAAMIDAALVGTDLGRDAYWAAVRKGYNTPYNDPPRRGASAAPAEPIIEILLESEALTAPASAGPEVHAA